jgi:hypothetical protein
MESEMTHNELVDLLDGMHREDWMTGFNAVHAVVKLHTYVQTNRGKSGLAKRCTECGFAYPCPTIQSIKKELTR